MMLTCKLKMLSSKSLLTLSLVTRKGFQRNIISLTQLVPSRLFPQKMNICNTRYLSGTTNKSLHHAGSIQGHSVHMCTDSKVSKPSSIKVKRGKSYETVDELLDFFTTSKHSLGTTDLANILYKIARNVWHDEKQRQELQKLRGTSPQGRSMFKDLLNYTAESIANTDLDEKLVEKIIWSLDKIGETNHDLYKKFEKGKIVILK